MGQRRVVWFLFLVFACSAFSAQGRAAAEPMYVTDKLYLSVRSEPHAESPSQTVISSNTEVEVVERSGEWVRILLGDDRTGWVMEKYLVDEAPNSQTIDALRREIETKTQSLHTLRQETEIKSQAIENLNTRVKEMSLRIEELNKKVEDEAVTSGEPRGQTDTVDLVKTLQVENASLKTRVAEMEALRTSEAALGRRVEALEKQLAEVNEGGTREGQGIFYLLGVGAFVIGLILGYVVKRPDKNRFYLR